MEFRIHENSLHSHTQWRGEAGQIKYVTLPYEQNKNARVIINGTCLLILILG